jgi:hypothetical protein
VPGAAGQPVGRHPGRVRCPAISAAGWYAGALLADGTVTCWRYPEYEPVQVEGLSGATAIATTTLQACALKADGTVQCWVLESRLVPREGEPMPSLGPSPVAVAGISNAIAISEGGDRTCVLLHDGSVKCWGGSYGLRPEEVPVA